MSMRITHVHEALPAVGDPEGGWNWASLPPSTKTRKRNWGAGQVMGRAGKCGRQGRFLRFALRFREAPSPPPAAAQTPPCPGPEGASHIFYLFIFYSGEEKLY